MSKDVQARSPNSDSSERSGSGVLDAESSRLDDQDTQFEDDRGNDVDGEVEVERKPFEGMREYAESTMQELLAIYGLAGGELAKSVSRQLPPTFLNPNAGQQAQGECCTFQIRRLLASLIPDRNNLHNSHVKFSLRKKSDD